MLFDDFSKMVDSQDAPFPWPQQEHETFPAFLTVTPAAVRLHVRTKLEQLYGVKRSKKF